MHWSPYGAMGINDTVIFTPIFDKHHVDLVIHGHDHLYLRSVPLYNGKKTPGGTIYLESGSSGSEFISWLNKASGISEDSDYADMFVSGMDSNSCKITNGLKYQDGISVKKSKYNEIPSIRLDKNDANYRVTFSGAEEEGASFSSITQNSVISVALSSTDDEAPETARIRRVYVSNLSASGTVTSVFEDDGDDYFVIDGKAYRASKSYYNTYNGGNSIDFSTIGLGDSVSLYLDYDGRIAYSEKKINEQMGILLKASICNDFEDEYNLRFFNAYGETVDYKIKSDKYKKFSMDTVNLPALAEYRTSGDYICDIDFDMNFKEYGSFSCLKNSNRFGNYFYNDNTLMFLYDGMKNDENASNPDYYYSVTAQYLKKQAFL